MNLLGKLCIALQAREGNAKKLFEHENTDVPPSLSSSGRLCEGSLVTCIEEYGMSSTARIIETEDAVMTDGHCDVHILNPTKLQDVKTFDDHTTKVFIPHLLKLLTNARRLDITWEWYHLRSLKGV